VDTQACYFGDPSAGLFIQVRQIAKFTQGQKVAFDVFNARLDDAFLLWVIRWARINLEAVAFGALGIGTLYRRILGTGLIDPAR
jgi:hypothetical protein